MISTIAIANEFIRLSKFSLSFEELQDCLILTEGLWSKFRDTRLLSSSFSQEKDGPISLSTFYAYDSKLSKLATDYCGEVISLSDESLKELVAYVYQQYFLIDLASLKTLQKSLPAGPYKLIDFLEIKQAFSNNYFFSTL